MSKKLIQWIAMLINLEFDLEHMIYELDKMELLDHNDKKRMCEITSCLKTLTIIVNRIDTNFNQEFAAK